MKKLFLGFVFLMILFNAPFCLAGSHVTFIWDKSPESDLAGYRLYQSNTSGVYKTGEENAVAVIPAGTETVTVTDVLDGQWYWVLTAYDRSGNESDYSNEVDGILDTVPPGAPNITITMILEIP